MKLYHKQLNSLEALKREKLKLKLKQKAAGSEFKIPFPDINKHNSEKKSGIDWIGTASKLFASKSALDIALSFGAPLLGAVGRKGGGKLKKLAVEVLGGYLKWKLVEVGLNVTKGIIKNKKHKKDAK